LVGLQKRASMDAHQLPAQQLLPALRELLEEVLADLPAKDITRLLLSDNVTYTNTHALKPKVLLRRQLSDGFSWQKAHAVETALFMDMLASCHMWSSGPNNKSEGNSMECRTDPNPWMWMSGGTDWQGFQGIFRRISCDGVKPSWISFRVRSATLNLSGACISFAGQQHRWGLSDVVLSFNYKGDESSQQSRCFAVSGSAPHPNHTFCPDSPVQADRPYDIAFKLDWVAGKITVFVDGIMKASGIDFGTRQPIRYIAVYNWRSNARTAISELIIGNSAPAGIGQKNVGMTSFKPWNGRCPRRIASPSQAIPMTKANLAIAAAVMVAISAIAIQRMSII